MLWKLSVEDLDLGAVVVRIFGQQTDKIIDRDHEKGVLGPLNAAGFGAQVPRLCRGMQTCFPCPSHMTSNESLLSRFISI